MKALGGIVIGIIAILLVIIGLNFFQEQKLNNWAKAVPLSSEQRQAMTAIWEGYKAGIAPKPDPLAKLSSADREYIRKICSDGFRPEGVPDPEPFPSRKYEELTSLGFTSAQIDVIMGMTANHVGRKDL